MMPSRIWLGVAGWLLCSGCTIERADVRTPGGEPPEADTTRVRAAVEAIASAVERGDRTALDTLYHDSLVVYRAGRVRAGAEARVWSPPAVGDSEGMRRLRITGPTVRLENGTAWATFRYEWTDAAGDPEEGAAPARGLATFIFRESGGGWRLIHAHISEDG